MIFSADDRVHGYEPWQVFKEVPRGPGPCEPSKNHLCLLEGRIEVKVRWRNPNTLETGVGTAARFPDSDISGTFWFFEETNVELIVKALDGTPVNAHQWFFYGALSDVDYWIDIRDTTTGNTRTYFNPAGKFCGQADTQAFPSLLDQPEAVASSADWEQGPGVVSLLKSACESEESLCLRSDRFEVQVEWKALGREGTGTAIPASDQTGFFWFFKPDNVELAVKILDGRPVNGNFWVFFAALSDVEYQVQVHDLQTGKTKTYENPQGDVCGEIDTSAFQ